MGWCVILHRGRMPDRVPGDVKNESGPGISGDSGLTLLGD